MNSTPLLYRSILTNKCVQVNREFLLRRYRDTPSANSHAVFRCPLDSLPYEIMEEIAELLFVTPGQKHFLKLFSLTCKRIRRLCAPILFRSIMVSIEYKLLPGRVFHDTGKFWLYVKYVLQTTDQW